MRTLRWKIVAATAASLCAMLAAAPAQALQFDISTVMTGLVTPRDLAFAPDGSLYVTEAGSGGAVPSFPLGAGTFAMGYTGGLSRLSGGVQSRVLGGLPSIARAGAGTEASGLNDIVFDAGGQAYGVFGWGGDPAGRKQLGAYGASLFGTVAQLKLDGSGTVTPIADIAQHEADNNPAGGTIDSNPYGLARTADGRFVVADAGGNSFVQATMAGVVSTLGVLPARPNPLPFGPPFFQSVPTGVAIGPDGSATIGQLTGFPFPPGAANVYRHDLIGGTTGVAFTGFTNIIDVDFDAAGNLYVLQLTSNGLAAPGGPGSGVLIKIDGQTGQRTTLVDEGLFFPGGVAIEGGGPWGPTFYVSTHTNTPLGGTVLRITPVPEPGTWGMMAAGLACLGAVARRRRG